MGRQVFEPVGPLFHEVLVVKIFLDDHVQKGEGQGVVRSRPQGKPVCRFFRQVRLPGVHDDEIHAFFQLFQEETADLSLLVGRRDVASPQDGETARVMEIGHGIKAAGVDSRDFPRSVTDILGRHHVGGPEEVGQPDEYEVLEPLGHAHAEGDGPGAVGIPDPVEGFGRFRQGVFPGKGGPLPAASFPHPLQGGFEAVRVVQPVRGDDPLGAHVSLVQKPFGIALHLDDPVFLPVHAHQEGAAAVVHPRAVGPHPRDSILLLLLFHGLSPFFYSSLHGLPSFRQGTGG